MVGSRKNDRQWPIEQSTVRTWSLLAIIPTLLVGGYVIGTKLTTIQTQLNRALEDRFDRGDAAEWCFSLAADNPGFKCVNPYELPSFRMGRRKKTAHSPRPLATRP